MPDDNILDKVISFISGSSSGDDKQILLRQLAKEVQQNKFAKFYRPRQEEADVILAQYFHGIYKLIYPARIFFRDPEIFDRIKQVTLESYLDKSVIELLKKLTPDALAKRKAVVDANLSAELEEDLAALNRGFDNPKLAEADRCFELTTIFYKFVSYDYYSLFRKFDPDFRDDFTAPPKFAPLRADVIMNDLALFMSALHPIDYHDDWKPVLDIFKYCNGGTTVIPQETWNGLLNNIRELKQSRILEYIVRLASGNPVWDAKAPPMPREVLSSDWLANVTSEVRDVITSISDSQRNAKIMMLENEVFNTSEVVRLGNYTKEKGKLLTQKDVITYIYAPALNHLAAFIDDFLGKEMVDLCDLLLVRGQWTQNAASISMSEAYHSVVDITSEITALDESLSNEGSNGPRLKGALLRVDRDRSQSRYLNSIIDSLNEEALNIINRAIPLLITVGKHLKNLVDDCQRKSYEVIMNWKELALISKTPMAQRLGDNYKRINCFVQLMLLETQQSEGEEEEE